MTRMIEKSSYDKDIWVQRGISPSAKIFQIPGEKIKKSILEMTSSEMQSLVGTTFKEKGFYSAGAGKGTGFDHKGVILNTYCPRGTKMLYVGDSKTKSFYGKTDENEMILQRGYEYRITKIQKVGSRVYVDCEVLLNSNKDMAVGEELDNLWNKYGHQY